MEEIWKDIEGLEGRYQVSNLGRARSVKRIDFIACGRRSKFKPRVLKTVRDHCGYIHVAVSEGRPLMHRLVATAFVPNPENKRTVNHKDGNKENNRFDNLEWCTQKENVRHAFRTGLINSRRGSANNFSKLDELSVRVIRDLYATGIRKRREISNYFKVSASTIGLIVRRKIWVHV